MRDAESSEEETEWKSDDEEEAPPVREWRPNSAGRGMAAARQSHVQASNTSLTPAANGERKPKTQPESEPTSSETSAEPASEPADPPADPWLMEDPWAQGRDPWSTQGRQQDQRANGRSQDPPATPHPKAPPPAPPDPWADGQDPWATRKDPWANGTNPGANGCSRQDPSAGMSSVSPDPWQEGSDPWSRQDAGAKGYQGNRGKGTQAAQPAWQEEQQTKGELGAKGQKGSGFAGKSKADPLLENDPWAEAAGKGRNPGKGAPEQNDSARSSQQMPHPLSAGTRPRAPESPSTAPDREPLRRDTPEPPQPSPPRPKAEPARPKPSPPRPSSSDGDGSQSQARSSQSGGSRFRRAAEKLPEAQKTDFLDYKARCLQLGFFASRCCQVEVRANRQVNMPGYLKCEKEEILLLRFVRDGFALLEDFPSRASKRTGWVPLECLKPVDPYDFYVKVLKKPGVRLGLLGEELDFADGVGRILVVRVEDPRDGSSGETLLSSWNERCQQCFTRDQLLPGDLITCVNGFTSLKDMMREIQDGPPNTMLKLHILRHEPTLSPVWESLAGHGLGLHPFAQPARPHVPRFSEIDQFQ